jgi:hypothetical protein
MADYILDVPRQVTENVPVSFQVWQLALTRADKHTPASVVILLRAMENEEWDDSVEPIRVDILDASADDHKATDLRGLIMAAVVPNDDPIAKAYGIGGKTVREAGVQVLQALAHLTPVAAPAPV